MPTISSVAALKDRALDRDQSLELALGAAIEVQAQVRVAQGRRSDALYFLRRELDAYRNTTLHMRIQKNINLLSLEGQSAPPLQAGEELGRPTPELRALKGKVVVLFFWAHWCGECKRAGADSVDAVRRAQCRRPCRCRTDATVWLHAQPRGRSARCRARTHREGPRRVLPFLRSASVPVTEQNHKLYGVSTTPTLVVLDRQGIVRLYHPGTMTAGELDAVIKPLLAARAAD